MASTSVDITGATSLVGYSVTPPFTTSDVYTFSFPYLDQADFEIKVQSETVLDTADYTFTQDYLIQLTTTGVDKLNALYGSLTSVSVVIRRKTTIDHRLVDFTDNSTLTETELDLMNLQLFYLAQEMYDDVLVTGIGKDPVSGSLDLSGTELINIDDPTTESSAVNLRTLYNNVITPDYTEGATYRAQRLVFYSGDLYRANKDISEAPATLDTNDFDLVIDASELSKIATLESGIAANVADIAANVADIATNATNIATNVANIATNSVDISNLDTNKLDKIGGTVSGDLIVSGNLTVDGTTTSVNSSTLDVADANITLNSGGTKSSADLNSAGLTIAMSDDTDSIIGFDSTLASKFKIGQVGSEKEIITTGHPQSMKNKTLEAANASTEPVVIKGASAQTADLVKVTDSDNTNVFNVENDGALRIKGGTSNSDYSIVRNDATDQYISIYGGSGNRGIRLNSDSYVIDFDKYGQTFYTGNSATRHNGTGFTNRPSYSWRADTDTGMYRTGDNEIGFSCGASLKAQITANEFKLTDIVFKPAQYTTATLPDATVNTGALAYDTDTNTLKVSDGIKWSSAGSGSGVGGGSLREFYQETFETVTAGAFTTDSGTIGTGGGTFSGTLAIETASPLSGAQSVKYTQASGSLDDFFYLSNIPVPLKFQSSKIEISGAFSYDGKIGDMAVYLYDVTNSTIIKDGNGNDASFDPAIQSGMTVNLSGTASIRFVPKVLVENVGKVLLFDDIEIIGNPDKNVSIYASTQDEEFTPPTYNGLGSPTPSLRKIREGKFLHIYGSIVTGTVSASEARIYLPSGLTAENKTDSGYYQVGTYFGDQTSADKGGAITVADGNNYVTFGNAATFNSTSVNPISRVLGTNFSSGARYTIDFKVPILGWSDKEDNVTVANTDQVFDRKIFFRSSPSQNIPDSSDETIIYNGQAGVSEGNRVSVNSTTGEISVSTDGWYDFKTTLKLSSLTGNVTLKLYNNTDSVTEMFTSTPFSSSEGSVTLSSTLYLKSGKSYFVQVYQNSPGVITLEAGSDRSFLSINYNPSFREVVSAYLDESKVIASYYLATGRSLTSTGNIIFDTKIVDTKSAYNTGTGVFTVPSSGYYRVSSVLFSVNATESWQYVLYHNAANIARTNTSAVYQVSGQSSSMLSPFVLYANKGDSLYFSLDVGIATGSIYANNQDNYMVIEKI